MNISQIVHRVLHHDRIWGKDGRIISNSKIRKISGRIFNAINRGEYDSLIEAYRDQDEIRKAHENEVLFVRMALRLGLDRPPRLTILDIGGKAGSFAFVCRSLGHEAWTSDMEETLTRFPNSELLRLFGVPALPLMIKPFEPIPSLGVRYDLITGFRTRFHSRLTWETGLAHEIHWGPAEWDYFLRDLAQNHLTSNGRIFFLMNRLQEKTKGGGIPDKMADYFMSVGGRVNKVPMLQIDDLSILRTSNTVA